MTMKKIEKKKKQKMEKKSERKTNENHTVYSMHIFL